MTPEQYEFRRPCAVQLGHTSTTGRMVARLNDSVLVQTDRGQYITVPFADVTPQPMHPTVVPRRTYELQNGDIVLHQGARFRLSHKHIYRTQDDGEQTYAFDTEYLGLYSCDCSIPAYRLRSWVIKGDSRAMWAVECAS